MKDNVIQLNNDEDILRFTIKDKDGKETGECLEFNLQDIELPIKWQNLVEEDKKARTYLQNQFTIISKKQDHKGKKLLSANEEAKIKAMQEFYKKEIGIYNMFLGENGVQKLLNGGQVSWNTFERIDKIIVDTILPKLKINADDIKKQIMTKYTNKNKRDDVIE